MLDYDAIYDEIEKEFDRVAKKQESKLLFSKTGYTEEEIAELERAIGTRIAYDYRQFLMRYDYFRLFDIYVVPFIKSYAEDIIRLKEIREEMDAPIPDNMYVLGEFDPECPIFLQDTEGKVYELIWDYKFSKPKKIANSFIDFMNKRIEYYDNLPVE